LPFAPFSTSPGEASWAERIPSSELIRILGSRGELPGPPDRYPVPQPILQVQDDVILSREYQHAVVPEKAQERAKPKPLHFIDCSPRKRKDNPSGQDSLAKRNKVLLNRIRKSMTKLRDDFDELERQHNEF